MPFSLPKDMENLFSIYCANCHGQNGKGNVNLSLLDKRKPNERLELLNTVHEQIFFKLMPPAKSDQPDASEVAALNKSVIGELRQHKAA